MAGLDPAIPAISTEWVGAKEGKDHRVKPGDDDFNWYDGITWPT
jgi:hypothetical protein